MMQLFYEKKDFFSLKELEKLCQKEKGITSMSVKDVLQSLVDDAMVDTEKIGTSVYFWAFPSKASQNRKRKIEDLEQKCRDLKRKKDDTSQQVREARGGREETPVRETLLHELMTLRQRRAELDDALRQYGDCDPDVMRHKQTEAATAKEAANRWTDNIFAVKSWARRKFSIDESTLNKQFDISPELDYVE